MPDMSFAAILKHLRTQAGLSVAALAARSGLHRQTIYKLERGSIPEWNTVQRIAEALNVSTDELRQHQVEDRPPDVASPRP